MQSKFTKFWSYPYVEVRPPRTHGWKINKNELRYHCLYLCSPGCRICDHPWILIAWTLVQMLVVVSVVAFLGQSPLQLLAPQRRARPQRGWHPLEDVVAHELLEPAGVKTGTVDWDLKRNKKTNLTNVKVRMNNSNWLEIEMNFVDETKMKLN